MLDAFIEPLFAHSFLDSSIDSPTLAPQHWNQKGGREGGSAAAAAAEAETETRIGYVCVRAVPYDESMYTYMCCLVEQRTNEGTNETEMMVMVMAMMMMMVVYGGSAACLCNVVRCNALIWGEGEHL